MENDERISWKKNLEDAFRIPDEEERGRVIESHSEELWKLGPIIVRAKNTKNCPDSCCEMDQVVIEEYRTREAAHFAMCFADNVIKPVWSIVLDVEI
ncbi:hypothetical protein [Rhodococcus qingshengii]|uniref:hypothetical protein n=1 Tax=Rhodococcus qingshengii TaxID=334542 RepID=UPI0035DD9048